MHFSVEILEADEVFFTAARQRLVDGPEYNAAGTMSSPRAATVTSVQADGSAEHIPAVEPFPSISTWCKFIADETLRTGTHSQVFLVSKDDLWKLWAPYQAKLGDRWTQILPQYTSFDPVYDKGACLSRRSELLLFSVYSTLLFTGR